MVVGRLLLGPANHGDVAKIGVNPIEDLATEVDLALEKSVKRVFDVLHGSAEWGELLGEVT